MPRWLRLLFTWLFPDESGKKDETPEEGKRDTYAW